jgi:hypothetical protein
MGQQFKGAWAVFEYLDDTCASIRELKGAGYDKITTHTPCPCPEIDTELGDARSPVPFFTLIGGICGLVMAVVLMVYTALDWVLPVSAKPIVSAPIMAPVAFELSVFTAAVFTAIAIAVLIWRDQRAHPVPRSEKYRKYHRFMRDRFGVVVHCGKEDLSTAESILQKYQAEEVHVEG